MGRSSGKSGGDRILESRHLVGLFLGVVLLCGVFFTLGYVMGHQQYGGAVHAADSFMKSLADPESVAPEPVAKDKPSSAPVSPSAAEWDFYAKKDNNHLGPAAAPAPAPTVAAPLDVKSSSPSSASQPVGSAPKASVRSQTPRLTKGAVVLQLAALSHESDALAMADTLQAKKFPSFVVAPSGDKLYRVQVGPYADEKKAEAAKTALDHAGFKAIIKR